MFYKHLERSMPKVPYSAIQLLSLLHHLDLFVTFLTQLLGYRARNTNHSVKSSHSTTKHNRPFPFDA